MKCHSYLLVRHPAVLERLHQEIGSTVHNVDDLTRAQINKLSYLRCVLNESGKACVPHRLVFSLTKIFPYFQLKDFTLNYRSTYAFPSILPRGGGPDGCSPVLIRRGTGVGFSTYHMHRLKSLYGEDASEFRPERWAGSELDDIGWGFMPFHGGPRICLGSK